MSCFVSHTSLDCRNAYELSEWWKPVIDYVDHDDDPNQPGDEMCAIRDPETGHELLFIEVPEEKSVKNRLHLDLRPRTGTRDEEIARLTAYGARQVADHRGIDGPGTGWMIFADPEGNEFCVLRSLGELEAG